jgi:GNAT superfamily N-acetyltransferase
MMAAAPVVDSEVPVVVRVPSTAAEAVVPEVASLLSAVFGPSVLFQGIFLPDPATVTHTDPYATTAPAVPPPREPADADGYYTRALTWLFRKRLQLLLAAGGFLLLARDPASGRVVGTVGALPPDRKPTLATMVTHGLLAWPCRWGVGSMARALYIDAVLVQPPPGAWEVVMMGVDGSMQGRGVGTRLMRALLEAVAAEHHAAVGMGRSAHVHLTTQLAINVAFYRRLGFRLLDKIEVAAPRLGLPSFPSWSMALTLTLPGDSDDGEGATTASRPLRA